MVRCVPLAAVRGFIGWFGQRLRRGHEMFSPRDLVLPSPKCLGIAKMHKKSRVTVLRRPRHYLVKLYREQVPNSFRNR